MRYGLNMFCCSFKQNSSLSFIDCIKTEKGIDKSDKTGNKIKYLVSHQREHIGEEATHCTKHNPFIRIVLLKEPAQDASTDHVKCRHNEVVLTRKLVRLQAAVAKASTTLIYNPNG